MRKRDKERAGKIEKEGTGEAKARSWEKGSQGVAAGEAGQGEVGTFLLLQ